MAQSEMLQFGVAIMPKILGMMKFCLSHLLSSIFRIWYIKRKRCNAHQQLFSQNFFFHDSMTAIAGLCNRKKFKIMPRNFESFMGFLRYRIWQKVDFQKPQGES